MTTSENMREETEKITYFGISLREILAESWRRIHGVKGSILGAAIVAGIISFLIVMLAYGLRFFLGEWGRNLYIIYALQYAFNVFAYPLLAGVIILGIRRAVNQPISFSMAFDYYTKTVLTLSVIFSVTSYILFALLLYGGIDHFLAQLSSLLLIPLFAFASPLVIEKGMKPFDAIYTAIKIFIRYWFKIAVVHLFLFCINIVGHFFLIGDIWTVPLIFVAHGVLYRHLTASESEQSGINIAEKQMHLSLPSASEPVKKLVLEGSLLQNIIAVVMIVLLISSVCLRLYALYHARNIYPPDNIAINANYTCIHFNNKLYLLTPDEHIHQRVDLSDMGIYHAPTDIELLKDNSILIGDHDKGVILRCDIDNMSCNKIGPANGYEINDNFKFIADEKNNLLYVADTNNHRLLVQDMQGNYMNTVDHAANIDYPNDMAFDKKGLLWLSNTLHNRIISFEVKNDTLVETGSSIKLASLDTGIKEMTETLLKKKDLVKMTQNLLSENDLRKMKSDLEELTVSMDESNKTQRKMKDFFLHTRPLALAWGSNDNVWIAASDPYVNTGGIIVFDYEGKQINRISLPNKAIPVDMIHHNEMILVADIGQFDVYSLNKQSGEINNFGDETFQKELSQARDKLIFYQILKEWSGQSLLMLGFGVIILGIFVTMQKSLKKKSTESDSVRANDNIS